MKSIAPYAKVFGIPAFSAITFVMIAALVLRFWGIGFGLPFLFHNDEGFEVIRALQLASGQFDFDRIGKGGLFYVLFVEYGILFVVFRMLGIVGSTNDFAQLFVEDPSAFYLLGRATSAMFGAATAYYAFRIGKLAYSSRAGIFAGLFVAFNILHAELSHYITVDVPMTFLAMVCLFYAIRLSQDGSKRDYFLAALFAALAATTKVPAVLLLPSLLYAHWFFSSSAGRTFSKSILDKQLWQSAGVFLFVYLVLTPGIIVNFNTFFSATLRRFTGGQQPVAAESEAVQSAATELPNLFVFYGSKLADAATLPVFLVCLVGVGYAVAKRRAPDVMLLLFALPMYLILSVSDDPRLFYPRYILPVAPVLAVLGGRVLDRFLAGKILSRYRYAGHGIALALLATPFYQIATHNFSLSQPDTREVGRSWFLENVDPDSSVLIEGATARTRNSTIPLDNSKENLRASIEQFKGSEPGKARYFRLELNIDRPKRFDLWFYDPDDTLSLEQYREQGVDYLVLRPDEREIVRRDKRRRAFNELVEQDEAFRLVKSIEPDSLRRPGPHLEIYQVIH